MRTTCICPNCIEEFTVIHEEDNGSRVKFCPFCSFELEDGEDYIFDEEED